VRGPFITIRLDGNGRIYQPGETLSGEYRLLSMPPDDLKAVEVSVLWYTEGKGDEDLAVHEFWRLDADTGDCIDPARPGRFQTVLPNTPLTYEGQIVKIRWCVRVRAFLARGKQIVGQQLFRLGSVPPIRPVDRPRPSSARNGKAAERSAAKEAESPHGPLAHNAGEAGPATPHQRPDPSQPSAVRSGNN